MSAFTRRRRIASAGRLSRVQGQTYARHRETVRGVVIGPNLAQVSGRLVNAAGLDDKPAGSVVALQNMASAGAALYMPSSGSGGGAVSSGGRPGAGGVGAPDDFDPNLYTPIAIFNNHVDDPIHHERQHDLLSTFDHTISGQVAGHALIATSATAFDFRELAGGHAIDVSFNGNGNTFAVDPTDLDGAGIGVDGGDALYVKTGNTTQISGDSVAVNQAYAFDWLADHSWTNTLGSPSFASGFAGNGWRLDQGITYAGKNHLEVDYLTVRNLLRVYELLATQIRATNGNLFVSDSAKIETVTFAGSYILTIEGTNGTDYQPFAVGDLIRAQRFTGSAGPYQSNLQVTGITTGGDTRAFTATLISGDAPANGYEFVRLGNTTDATRQGAIYLAGSDNNAPFIDFVDGVDSFADWGTAAVNKMRLGNLDGRTDPIFGPLDGFGMYAENTYLKGKLSAANGDFVVNDAGVFIQAESTGSTTWDNYDTKITITTDPVDPTDSETVGQLWGSKYTDTGTTFNLLSLETRSDVDSGADVAYLRLQARAEDAPGPIIAGALVELRGGPDSDIYLYSKNDDGSAGTITLQGEVSLGSSAHLVPLAASAMDIGTAGKPFRALHVDTLYAGTTSSTDTGHNHNDLYYTESEIDSLLSNKAASVHTHAGLATVAYVDAGLAGKSATGHNHNDLYYTESEIDAFLANKSSTGHAHADLATIVYVDAQLAGKAASVHTHDDRYYTESEIDAQIAAIPGSAYYDTLYYRQATVDSAISAAIAGVAPAVHTHDKLYGSSLDFEDATGVYATLDRTAFRSADPVYIEGDGGQGLYIGMDGYIEARWMKAVTLSSQVFDVRQVTAISNTMVLAQGGRLHEDATMPSVTGGSGSFRLRDPETGPFRIFNVGDWAQIQAVGYGQVKTGAGLASPISLGNPFLPQAAAADTVTAGESWLEITGYARGDGYWEYAYTLEAGSTWIQYPAGTAVLRIGQEGDGLIRLSSDDGAGKTPYIDLSRITDAPWDGNTPMIRLGRLDGLGQITGGEQWGLAISSDWTDPDSSQFVASTIGDVYQKNIVSRWTEGETDTITIDPDTGIVMATAGSDDNRTREIEWYAPGKGTASARIYGRYWQDSEATNRDQVFALAQAERRNESRHRVTARLGATLYDYDNPFYLHNPWINVTAYDDGEIDGSEIDIKADSIRIAGDVTLGTGQDSDVGISGSVELVGSLKVIETEDGPAILIFQGLPTSTDGLVDGQAYLNNGVLTVYQE